MLKRKQSEIRFPLEQKLLLVVIPLIALSLMAVSVITYRVAKQNIQNRVSEYMEQYLLQLSSAIDNKLETSIQLNAQLSVNAQLSEILQEYHSAPSDEKFNYRQDVENIFVTIMSIYDNIRSIYVFDNYGNEFYLRIRSGIGLELLEQESWYQDALARQGAYVIFLDRHGGEENTTIGIARSIVNIYDRQSYGVALVEIPYSILAETIYGGNGKSNLQQGAIFIGDEQGNRIYATQSDDPYRDMGADGSTSLQMELQHVTNYIRIMDYRFDDKIRLTMEIPEQMRALSMPKFTLQPIVENAVLHGFTEKRADCEICISGQVQDGAARLRIVDNGCGIAADALEKINADLKEPFQPGQPRNGRVSIGIYNVNSRLKLNYGDKYGVRIFSEVGVGTTAEIEFPAVMQKPGADSALRLRMKKAEQEDADS